MDPPSPTTPPRRILVAGVGYVGQALARNLLGDRNVVFGLQRSACSHSSGVVPLRGDVTDPQSLASLPKQVDTIVYAISPEARSRPAYEDCYELGLTHLLERYPDSHILLLSSTTVYGGSPHTVDDTTPISPATETARVVARGEQLVLSRPAPSLVIRPSGIYGPGRTRFLARLNASGPDARHMGRLTNRIHRDDLVAILQRAINASWTGTLIASDLCPSTEETIHSWLKQRESPAAPRTESAQHVGQRKNPSMRAADRGHHGAESDHQVVSSRRVEQRAEPDPRIVPSRRSVASRQIVPSRLMATGYDFIYPSFREGYAELTAPRHD